MMICMRRETDAKAAASERSSECEFSVRPIDGELHLIVDLLRRETFAKCAGRFVCHGGVTHDAVAAECYLQLFCTQEQRSESLPTASAGEG